MLNAGFKITNAKAVTAGIVTLSEWTFMPDGESYKHVWCERWEVVTDKQMPIPDFHSHERWTLVAIVGDEARVLIPGCQVKGWALCRVPPLRPTMYRIQ